MPRIRLKTSNKTKSNNALRKHWSSKSKKKRLSAKSIAKITVATAFAAGVSIPTVLNELKKASKKTAPLTPPTPPLSQTPKGSTPPTSPNKKPTLNILGTIIPISEDYIFTDSSPKYIKYQIKYKKKVRQKKGPGYCTKIWFGGTVHDAFADHNNEFKIIYIKPGDLGIKVIGIKVIHTDAFCTIELSSSASGLVTFRYSTDVATIDYTQG